MIFLETWNLPGDLNMALDVVMGNLSYETGKAFFRLYSWERPTLSFGKHQKPVRFDGLDCVIRPTGGRAVLHWNEITYSVAFPRNSREYRLSVLSLYRKLSMLFLEAFKRLGIDVELSDGRWNSRNPNCFSSSARYELLLEGRKFMGSAQMRNDRFVLQHGSIKLRYDAEILEKVFEDRGNGIGLKELYDIDEREIIESVMDVFDNAYGLEPLGYGEIIDLIETAKKIRGDFVCPNCA